jgi:dGTPase
VEDPEGLLDVAQGYAEDAERAELGAAVVRLTSLPFWPSSYDGSLRDLAALKNLTSQLIGRFAGAAEAATRSAHGDGRLTRYGADLVVPREQRLEVAVLKAIANRWVMQRAGAESVYSDQRDLVQELVSALRVAGRAALDPVLRTAYDDAPDDGARLRVVVDQVASLTDRSAVAWHARHCRR